MTPGTSPAPRVVGVALILIGMGATLTSMGIALAPYGRWGARRFPLAGSVALRLLAVFDGVAARGLFQAAKPFIGFQRVAAIFCKGEDCIEVRFGHIAVGPSGPDFRKRFALFQGPATGPVDQILHHHIHRSGTIAVSVALPVGDSADGDIAFDDFQRISRHHDGAAGLVHPVVGTPNAL